jgi:hypothetical protein
VVASQAPRVLAEANKHPNQKVVVEAEMKAHNQLIVENLIVAVRGGVRTEGGEKVVDVEGGIAAVRDHAGEYENADAKTVKVVNLQIPIQVEWQIKQPKSSLEA